MTVRVPSVGGLLKMHGQGTVQLQASKQVPARDQMTAIKLLLADRDDEQAAEGEQSTAVGTRWVGGTNASAVIGE